MIKWEKYELFRYFSLELTFVNVLRVKLVFSTVFFQLLFFYHWPQRVFFTPLIFSCAHEILMSKICCVFCLCTVALKRATIHLIYNFSLFLPRTHRGEMDAISSALRINDLYHFSSHWHSLFEFTWSSEAQCHCVKGAVYSSMIIFC